MNYGVIPDKPLPRKIRLPISNPRWAKIVTPERQGEFRWSSLFRLPRRGRPDWLVAETVLRESGGLPDSRRGWQCDATFLAALAEENPSARDERLAGLSQGRIVGSTAFRAELRHELRAQADRAGRFEVLGADRDAV